MRTRHAVPLILAAILSAGCYRVVPVQSAESYSRGETVQVPTAVITTNDGEKIRLYVVTLAPDSIIGYERVGNTGSPQGDRIVFARTDVAQVERGEPNPAGIGLVIATILVVVLGIRLTLGG